MPDLGPMVAFPITWRISKNAPLNIDTGRRIMCANTAWAQDILIKQNAPRIQYYEVTFNPKNNCCLVHIIPKHTHLSEKDAHFKICPKNKCSSI